MFPHHPWIEHHLGATQNCRYCGRDFPMGGDVVYERDGRFMVGTLPANTIVELCSGGIVPPEEGAAA